MARKEKPIQWVEWKMMKHYQHDQDVTIPILKSAKLNSLIFYMYYDSNNREEFNKFKTVSSVALGSLLFMQRAEEFELAVVLAAANLPTSLFP